MRTTRKSVPGSRSRCRGLFFSQILLFFSANLNSPVSTPMTCQSPTRYIHRPPSKARILHASPSLVCCFYLERLAPPILSPAGAVGRLGCCGHNGAWPGRWGLACQRGFDVACFFMFRQVRAGWRRGAMT